MLLVVDSLRDPHGSWDRGDKQVPPSVQLALTFRSPGNERGQCLRTGDETPKQTNGPSLTTPELEGSSTV